MGDAPAQVTPTARLTRSAALLLISNLGGAALSFLIVALIGRGLGERGLGVYALALAWVYPLSLVVEFGVGTLMTREIASDGSQSGRMLTSAAALRLLIGSPVMLALIALAPLITADAESAAGIQIAAPMVIVTPFYSAFTAVLRARQAMLPILWLNIGMLASQAALTALALALGGGVLTALAINTATSAGQLVAAWAVCRTDAASSAESLPLRVDLIDMARRSAPFAIAGVLAALQMRLPIILLEQLTTTEAVGLFAAANRLIEGLRLFPNALFGAIFPSLSALAADSVGMQQVFRRGAAGLIAFGGAVGVGLTLFGAPILMVIYGAPFASASTALTLLGWALAAGALRGLATLRWYAAGREAGANRINAVLLIAQMAVGIPLIGLWGVEGAALTILLTESAALVWLGHLQADQNGRHSAARECLT
jgi:O-antigen/teichoic acid export membrane protein